MKKSNTEPEFIDPVLAKTSPKRSFSVIENERFGLVFAETGSINSGTGSGPRKNVQLKSNQVSKEKSGSVKNKKGVGGCCFSPPLLIAGLLYGECAYIR